MNRSLASGIFSVVSAKIVVLIVTAVSTPLLYRFLGASAYGDYAVLLSVFAIYMIFVSSGITDGVRKYLAEDRSVANWQEHVVGFYLRLAIWLAAIGILVMVAATEFGYVSVAFGEERAVYFYILAILVVTAQFRDYARKTLMGFGLERYSEPLKILDKVGFVVVAIPLTYVASVSSARCSATSSPVRSSRSSDWRSSTVESRCCRCFRRRPSGSHERRCLRSTR